MSLFASYNRGQASEPALDASSGLIIRIAAEADLPAVAAISAEREESSVSVQTLWLEKFVQRSQESGQASVHVATLNGEIIGYGKCSFFIPPEGAQSHTAPEGWYLGGLVVAPPFRRQTVGRQLTQVRLQWIAARARTAYYFANARNRVSIELHQRLGFIEVTREFFYPGTSFAGGEGILFKIVLS
jgi:ribosomal protein S18 acetylase RimI-like enzyme